MRSSSMRVTRAVAALACGALLLSACQTSDGDNEPSNAPTTDLGKKDPATGEPVVVGVLGRVEPDRDPTISAFRAVAEYVNGYLGGLNGHEIVLDECSTAAEPAKGTACGLKFVKAGAVAVLDNLSGVSLQVYQALDGSIPFIIPLATGDLEILGTKKGAVLSNPQGVGAAGTAIAVRDGVERAAMIVPDVPATTGPVRALAEPLYQVADISLDFIAVSLQTADPTPQVQQAIEGGAEQITIFGDPVFFASAAKAARQLGFDGKIVTSLTSIPDDLIASIPGGLENVVSVTNISRDESSEERLTFNTVMDQYAPQDYEAGDPAVAAFQLLLGLQRVLALTPEADVDASTVLDALRHMPEPLDVPLGGGVQFQCGANPVPALPGVCTSQVLSITLDEDGGVVEEEAIDPLKEVLGR